MGFRMTQDLEYLWVINRKDADRWLVSAWDGEPYWLPIAGVSTKPDLDFGKPVVRRIGNGYIAEHFRFERN